LQLWDIAGQERFGSMTRIYYKAAAGALIVFDVTKPDSFESVIKWKEDFSINIKSYEPLTKDIPIILVGNKVDKIDVNDREIWRQRMEDFIALDKRVNEKEEFSPRIVSCVLCSAKEKLNINETLESITKHILEKEDPNSFVNMDPDTPNTNGGGCCN